MAISVPEVQQQVELFAGELSGKNILLIVPDATRSGGEYVGAAVKGICRATKGRAEKVTVLIALGTHVAMPQEKIYNYLGISADEHQEEFPYLEFANHEWKDPSKLTAIGTLTRDDMLRLSHGKFDFDKVRFSEGVVVDINYRVPLADEVVIIGPVLPHEVVGISGGNKYFFPGVSGPRVTQTTHWLGALETIPNVIGRPRTVVRDAIDFLATMVKVPTKRCLALVVSGKELHDMFWGPPEEAHAKAAARTLEFNARYVDRTYKRVVAVCSPKYPEIWTAGKCSYKLQGIVEDGGELIIYAPHLDKVSASWGAQIESVGYHCLPYIEAHLSEYLDAEVPLGVLAHVTHVMGVGTYENGVEKPRITITMASALTPDKCKHINLNYRDPSTVDLQVYRQEPDTLVVDDAGEVLYLLRGSD